MREAKIHKRDRKTRCAILSLDHHGWSRCSCIIGDDLLTDDWGKTTCGNCLRTKPKGVFSEQSVAA